MDLAPEKLASLPSRSVELPSMEKGLKEVPEPSERTFTVSWNRAKDTLTLSLMGLLGTLALSTLNGVRDSIKELNEKISTVIATQSSQKSDSESQKDRVSKLEERMTFIEREELSARQSRH